MAKRKCSAAQKAVVLLLAALMAITMGSSSLVFATGEEAVKSAPEIQKGDTAVKMTGRPNASTGKADVSFTLTGADEDWMQAVTEVDRDGTVVEKREAETGRPVEDSNLKADINEYGIVKTGEGKAAAYTLVIDSRLFESVRSAKHQVVVKATGYEDAVKEVTVTSFGAHKLFVRHLDKDGRVVDTKTFTIDEIEKLEAFKQDVLQQGICSHHGIRGFRANGVALNDLFKAAGMDAYWKDGAEIRLRVNDADDAKENDEEAQDNYMAEGAFSYAFLNQPRYIFTDIYQDQNEKLYNDLVALQDTTTKIGETTFHNYLNEDMRTLLATGKKQAVEPFLATEMYENDLDDPKAPGTNYGTTRENYGFRFFYGLAMENDNMVAKDETNQRLAYYVYGIDLQDTDIHSLDRTALDSEVQKVWKMNSADYTPESWEKVQKAFDAAKLLVYVEGLNQNVKQHWKTDQAFLDKHLKALKDAEAALVKVKKDEPAKKPVKPVVKKANPMIVAAVKKTFKAKKLKKKAATFVAITVKKGQGKVTMTAKPVNAKAKKALKFNKGKITVAKKTKKGTYKMKVTVRAAGNGTYKAKAVTKIVTVKVK